MRWDSLLVRDLAAELDARYAGKRVRALSFDRDARRVLLALDEESLVWDLDPARGSLYRASATRDPGNVPLGRGTRLRGVHAPPDERLLDISMQPASGESGARSLCIELIPNRWNAFALGAERRVLAILRGGATAARELAPGDVYTSPRPSMRLATREPVSLDEWLRLLLPTPPRERRRRILDTLAFTSPVNVDWILGEERHDPDADLLRAAHARYVSLVGGGLRQPCLLRRDGLTQPYPVRLTDDAVPQPGLLEAFEDALRHQGRAPAPTAGAVAEEAADRIRGRISQAERRIQRLRYELQGAPDDAAARRRLADLLMSQLHRVRKGDDHIVLDDMEGGRIRLDLDPSISPADNGTRLYEAARKRARAAGRLPQLIQRATEERDALRALLDRIRSGEAREEEIRGALGVEARRPQTRTGEGSLLPFRRYRTSGGLEVRVGRSSAANDALTFHHSSPNDIWLHARDTAGAHVILRWTDRDANPPAADLVEAAVLAALHSRARTAGTVPVDWTRRKHVRKPRKSPPGQVAVDRARTLFVEPDAALDRRLRWDPLDLTRG